MRLVDLAIPDEVLRDVIQVLDDLAYLVAVVEGVSVEPEPLVDAV